MCLYIYVFIKQVYPKYKKSLYNKFIFTKEEIKLGIYTNKLYLIYNEDFPMMKK